jgi:hypothetical protein
LDSLGSSNEDDDDLINNVFYFLVVFVFNKHRDDVLLISDCQALVLSILGGLDDLLDVVSHDQGVLEKGRVRRRDLPLEERWDEQS